NTVPVSPGFSMITTSIPLAFHQAVLFNVARFSALSSQFRKIFRFFFRVGTRLRGNQIQRCIILR
ncbi:MAG: hypothetical protein IKQ82_06425, partial [Lentisphaeria bacterium]|nr:hypothetical protein [Lentisphaeria bacterium]